MAGKGEGALVGAVARGGGGGEGGGVVRVEGGGEGDHAVGLPAEAAAAERGQGT